MHLTHHPFSDPDIQERRSDVYVEGAMTANDYVPLFIGRKSPMQYLIASKRGWKQDGIVYFCVRSDIFGEPGVAFSDGNVAARGTRILLDFNELATLDWNVIKSDSWDAPDETVKAERKLRKSAEILVPNEVNPSWFSRIIVHDANALSNVRYAISKSPAKPPVEVDASKEFYF
jgi:hypothetical protein